MKTFHTCAQQQIPLLGTGETKAEIDSQSLGAVKVVVKGPTVVIVIAAIIRNLHGRFTKCVKIPYEPTKKSKQIPRDSKDLGMLQ
jgi:hypothetical protein